LVVSTQYTFIVSVAMLVGELCDDATGDGVPVPAAATVITVPLSRLVQ
jgi:hypothetical protein